MVLLPVSSTALSSGVAFDPLNMTVIPERV